MNEHQRSLIEQMQNTNVEKEQKAFNTIEFVKNSVNSKVHEGKERPMQGTAPAYDPFSGL